MPRRSKNQNTLVLGQWNVLCDVCGMKFKSGDIKERWDGLKVCPDDFEARHVADFFRINGEDTSVPFNRPEDQGQQADDANTDINGDPFPDTSDPNGTLTSVPTGTNNGEL